MSAEIDDGGPAFPQHKFEPTGGGGGHWTSVGGASLLEWIAGQIMSGLCANKPYQNEASWRAASVRAAMAEEAVLSADALIAALKGVPA